ncbi:DUF4349 domain-containing protein [Sporosarcina sp. YIM B06819]|uniref:DUF4349 domain-containing protein n=1 Tax=Sporosarcina sp. YIM B06819 TaxID=3081769 RepID=UPI00298C50F0|nr:DUF4349 domain-containing protein [Sporosarcina sp. YIM B06819]
MNKKLFSILLLVILSMLVAACSASSSKDEAKSEKSMAGSNEIAMDNMMDRDAEEAPSEQAQVETTTNRMIIHHAQLQVKVKEFEQAQLKIEKKVNDYGGYIVESTVYGQDTEAVSGTMIIRIPEKHFQAFLKDAEEEATILERNVTGQDVTEQYVDLKSRVTSKRAVEARLLEFMGQAQKTEDLLKISADLAIVQEEIEVIVGKMNYLENQTSYSTIEISMYEDRVIVPALDKNNLDTWDKTKKQLATSTNFMLAAGSGLIVFFIGNLPVIILLALIGVSIYFIIKRKKPTK